MRPDDKTGGPAYPSVRSTSTNKGHTIDERRYFRDRGATVRDYFAARAPEMPDSVWGGEPDLSDDTTRAAYFAVRAMWAYEFADAMLSARGDVP